MTGIFIIRNDRIIKSNSFIHSEGLLEENINN